jgi:hypothetical protein
MGVRHGGILGRFGRLIAIVTACFALLVGAALADSGVVTGEATSITDSSAVLHGHIGIDRTAAAWFFQVGTTPVFPGHARPRTIAANGTSVKQKVTHLMPDTKYYYTLVVIEGGYIPKVIFGSTRHFTTK